MGELVSKTLETFGRVDVVINNAAIDYPGPITDLTVEQWDEIIGVNMWRFLHVKCGFSGHDQTTIRVYH